MQEQMQAEPVLSLADNAALEPNPKNFLLLLSKAGEANLDLAWVQERFEGLGSVVGFEADGEPVLLNVDSVRMGTVYSAIEHRLKFPEDKTQGVTEDGSAGMGYGGHDNRNTVDPGEDSERSAGFDNSGIEKRGVSCDSEEPKGSENVQGGHSQTMGQAEAEQGTETTSESAALYGELIDFYGRDLDRGLLYFAEVEDLAVVGDEIHEAFYHYAKTCKDSKIDLFPGMTPKPVVDARVNPETGEVDIPAILQVLGFVEFPKLDDPDIEEKINKIGDVMASDLERMARYRKNAEDRCEKVQRHFNDYKQIFGELITAYAKSKLKRVKTGPNAGKITGSKTVIFETFAVSFEKTGGAFLDKAKFEKAVTEDPKLQKELGIELETKPKYKSDQVIKKLIALYKPDELPDYIRDYPVNEAGKYEIKGGK